MAVRVDLSGFGPRSGRLPRQAPYRPRGRRRAGPRRIASSGSRSTPRRAHLDLDPASSTPWPPRKRSTCHPTTPPRWCPSIPWWASSGCITPVLRSGLRPRGAGGRARGPCSRRAPGRPVPPRGRTDRRPPGLRAHGGAAATPLRRRRGLQLPGPGPEALEALPLTVAASLTRAHGPGEPTTTRMRARPPRNRSPRTPRRSHARYS